MAGPTEYTSVVPIEPSVTSLPEAGSSGTGRVDPRAMA